MDGMGKQPLARQLMVVVLAAGAVLLAPLVAMAFTDEVAWSPLDFAVAALLLVGGGAAWVLAAQRLRGRGRRLLAAAGLAALVLLVWAELAVGVFGTPLAGS